MEGGVEKYFLPRAGEGGTIMVRVRVRVWLKHNERILENKLEKITKKKRFEKKEKEKT